MIFRDHIPIVLSSSKVHHIIFNVSKSRDLLHTYKTNIWRHRRKLPPPPPPPELYFNFLYEFRKSTIEMPQDATPSWLGGQKYETYAIRQHRGVQNAILHKNPEHFCFKN